MTNSRIWILGAPDPEMKLIERVLRHRGESVVYATDSDGERVHPGNMYDACTPGAGIIDRPGVTAYLVECDSHSARKHDVVRIDHHRLGDPGYGRPPSEYLAASSIGQVLAELAGLGLLDPASEGMDCLDGGEGGWAHNGAGTWSLCNYGFHAPTVWFPTKEVLYTAAADHCLGAAYAGECPGVDPDGLMRHRIAQRAEFLGRDPADVEADVQNARSRIADAPRIDVGCQNCGDLPHDGVYGVLDLDAYGEPVIGGLAPCGDMHRFPAPVVDLRGGQPTPELPEAAVREGVAVLAGPLSTPDGRQKYVLLGRCSPAVIREFVDGEIAPRLVDRYGDPARGFAGGYVPEEDMSQCKP